MARGARPLRRYRAGGGIRIPAEESGFRRRPLPSAELAIPLLRKICEPGPTVKWTARRCFPEQRGDFGGEAAKVCAKDGLDRDGLEIKFYLYFIDIVELTFHYKLFWLA